MMVQLQNEIELNPKIHTRQQKLSVFKGNLLNIMNRMLRHKSDYELPDVEFLFGGYCWQSQQFKIWRIVYQRNIERFVAHTIKFWRGSKGEIKVFFIGDYVPDAKQRLVTYLKSRDKFENGASLELEPLEVIRDMLLDPSAETKYRTIGGAPQLVKIYRSLNRVPFGVRWSYDGQEEVTLFGKPIKTFRQMPIPIIDPVTLKYSNTNAFR